MEERFKDIERLVKEAGLDTPSVTFLSEVMCSIENTRSYKEKVYTSLISRNSWIVIIASLICLVCLALLIPNTEKSIFSEIYFSLFDSIKFNSVKVSNPFLDFKFYKATLYGVVFLAILFFIQIPILKRRIDKNFS